MRALGVDAEKIEDARDQADVFNSDDDSEVVVWAENRNIVEVFMHCRWRTQVVSGMGGAVRLHDGIDAAEIAHTCELLQIEPSTRRDVLWGVRVMEAAAMPILNQPQ